MFIMMELIWISSSSDIMYQHRDPAKRFDVVDLDPYGTASPFLDSAVQCVADDGMFLFG